ncbi:unnamed protein product [Nesidiocoris tenuis]|uniref:Methylcrotonoyl-CoA carboxylase subunit alpha, mitochondrial n=1 Tax=Nesidiocoris tenuis TaxID=355587 RepID=A0A6H5HHV2_9HEMI|nr:unnamed protein product [Nesidiocoris tenuis]
MHVSMADEAYCIGLPQASESYLRGDKIIDVAKKCGAQAIHPGYGFLSENAEFAEECLKNSLIFLGPSPSAIRNMGVKSTSKDIMSRAGVPVVPGYHGQNQDVEFLKDKASEIGFPLMIKAVRGGGGKGMRIARKSDEFLAALESAKTESLRAFGDDVVLLEKFIESPRHVEVQVFGDAHGNTVHLFERDCSVQRRHQKVIEQAPGPHIDHELRMRLGETGVRAAQAVGYVGAGTVEFIYDPSDRSFYFMEMNTRLQVEHPVTEMITGVDLVEWQLRVGSGEALPLKQAELKLNGASIEARVYAESLTSEGNFMPAAGKLYSLGLPSGDATSLNLRIESGVAAGDDVSVHYDPMIAKVVVWGPDQESAFVAMSSALAGFNIVGVENNVSFLRRLVEIQDLVDGKVNTDFIPEHKQSLLPRPPCLSSLAKAALGYVLHHESESVRTLRLNENPNNPFIAVPNFRVNSNFTETLKTKCGGTSHVINVTKGENGWYTMDVDSKASFSFMGSAKQAENGFTDITATSPEGSEKSRLFFMGQKIYVFEKNSEYVVEVEPKTKSPDTLYDGASGGTVCPMPGVIDKVFVKAGDDVAAGDRLAVMISMKMEHVITAATAGKVESVLVAPGQNVIKGAPVIKLQENS